MSSHPWPLVVDAADDHLVAPALGWCLRGDERVPADARTCLETLLDLNRRRNRIMLEALDQAVASLNAVGITPMLLKGAAALATDLYPDAGMRIVGDLDLLVREPQIDAAAAALETGGFSVGAPRASFDADPHHLPLRVHAELRVGVELHRRPLPHSLDGLLDSTRCFENGRHQQWRNRQVLVPEPTDCLVHNIAHGQIAHGHYWRGIPRLRQLLEAALLRAHHGSAIDDARAAGQFRQAGYARVLADTMHLSALLLERPEVAWQSTETSPALERLKAAVERPAAQRWGTYRHFLLRNTRRLIDNPRFMARLLRPSFWTVELEGIRRRARPTRW